MFIPCFICAELLGEKNSLSVSLGTLCVPWSSHQAQLFVLFKWKLLPCVLPRGEGPPVHMGWRSWGMLLLPLCGVWEGPRDLLWGRGETVCGEALLTLNG